MMRRHSVLIAGAALLASVAGVSAQEAAAERGAMCVPPPCEAPTDYPPCDDAMLQQRMNGLEITAISTADGPEVRPLGGVLTGPPEIGVCARRGEQSFQLYVPGIDEPVLRLGMIAVLSAAMQARMPIDISYGLPNGALRKIEGLSFGAASDVPLLRCVYGDFDRCDTAYQVKAEAQNTRDSGHVQRINLIGYGKNSFAVQIVTDNKARPSYVLHPGVKPENYLHMMNLAVTSLLAGTPVEIVSTPGLAPIEAVDKTPPPPLALEMTQVAAR
jgi:hypothetical protein